jgi:hypothetical protein
MANTNCLAGIRCPSCGSEGPFIIEVTQQVRMYDDSVEECGGDIKWNGEAYMRCEACDFDGEVADFSVTDDEEPPDPLLVTNEDGITFAVRLVKKGDRYGLHGCLTHDIDEPLVEFYDTRYDHNSDWLEEFKGQFVSRYYAETLLGHEGGLCLDGGVSDWHVSVGNMADIKKWLKARGETT